MHNSLKDKVLESTDLVDVVGERVSLKRRGKEYVGLCPFHNDHKPSLSVSPKKQIFKCWSCGAGGDVIKFVQMLDRVDFREALAKLARRAGIDVREGPGDRAVAGRRDLVRRAMKWAREVFRRSLHETAEGKAALEYALQRGIDEETIRRHGLGFAVDSWDHLLRAAERAQVPTAVLHDGGLIATNDSGKTYDRFRNRLVFPITDALGRVVAFGGRTLGDDPAKYLNSPETVLFSKSRVLYGLDLARKAIEERREVLVVEGYMDAVLLHQHGFEHTVATLGTALTDAHLRVLRPLADAVVLCFDGDQAGERAADRAVETALKSRIPVRVVVLSSGKDPADCLSASGAAGFESELKQSIDALQFKWRLTVRAFGDRDERSRRAAVEDFLAFVAGVGTAGGIDPVEQGLLISRLSELLSVPAGTVYELLARAKSTVRRTTPSSAVSSGETSEYEATIQGLPRAVVTAVEDVFAAVLNDASLMQNLEAPFEAAIAYCDTWQRLHAICSDLSEQRSDFGRKDVLGRCEDSALCELVSRCCSRANADDAPAVTLRAALERLGSEFDVLKMDALRGNLREPDNADKGAHRAFESLLAVSRKQHAVLPAEERMLNNAATPQRKS